MVIAVGLMGDKRRTPPRGPPASGGMGEMGPSTQWGSAQSSALKRKGMRTRAAARMASGALLRVT